MEIREALHFSGTWRTYQKRVLDRADHYLKDKRVHIVAAPGSGKTTLGIELIGRLNAPCLILAPSITIRDQWIGRIKEAYLPADFDATGFLSNSIKEPAKITAITYQALHSGMTKYKGALEEENEDGNKTTEDVDYTGFDLIQTVKDMGFTTLCLDEAHHLRSEWWKALEELVAHIPGFTVVSLTATPPYDSTPAQWQRYVGLCGPIDEEIIVPELVKEGSLCPHQDYVYFNMPTQEEKDTVVKFRQEAFAFADELYRDKEFTNIICSHVGIRNPQNFGDVFLDNQEYLTALLVFLKSKEIGFSKDLLEMVGEGNRLPAMTNKWMEILLQGFLYEDTESFQCSEEYRETLERKMKARGLIQKKKVCLVENEAINKLLITSKGKINSILEVTKAEYENLGEDLRLLILTDYIKKEYLSAIGNLDKNVAELGVLPIFENLRRTFSGMKSDKNTTSSGERISAAALRMGVLSGTVVVIPECAKTALEAMIEESGMKGTFKDVCDGAYFQVTLSGTEQTIASMVTALFNQGFIRVLIGTKSLLGEGWDSPCINALILASFVGSFMLSNQMRGRAIRTQKGNPDKVSNIWHLICMEPEEASLENGGLLVSGVTSSGKVLTEVNTAQTQSSKRIAANSGNRTQSAAGAKMVSKESMADQESEDFATLRRRFEGFLGVHYEKPVIENRLNRLSYIKPPYTSEALGTINGNMVKQAADRNGLKAAWDAALAPLSQMEVAVEAGADKEYFKHGKLFYMALLKGIAWVAAALLLFTKLYLPLANAEGFFAGVGKWIIMGVMIFAGVKGAIQFVRFNTLSTPDKYLRAIGDCILKALLKEGSISTKNASVAVDLSEAEKSYVFLRGGSEREKDVFAQCVYEFFGGVDNQRYILEAKGKVPKLCKYYCVPEMFGKKKEDAMMFHQLVKYYIGNYQLFYTKNAEGKKKLLAARICSIANKGEAPVDKKKKVIN